MNVQNIDFEAKHFLRDVIGNYTKTMGEKNSKVVAVTADLMGTCRIRGFEEAYPDRFFNVGIAEQNMVSFAAGLAHEGFMPFVFTMAPFMSMRACEQVRTDVSYGNLNVRMMAVYAGLSGGISGATHWSMEDVGIMTSIPNVAVLEPCNAVEAERLMDLSLNHQGPIYMRSAVIPVVDLYDRENDDFHIGGSKEVMPGDDGAFLVSGVVVQYAVKAAMEIAKETGKYIRVVDMYSLKPVDEDAVKSAAETGRVIVAQDHNTYGGLGNLVAKVIAEEGIATQFTIKGVPDKFVAMAHAEYLYRQFGYDTEGLKSEMYRMLKVVNPKFSVGRI